MDKIVEDLGPGTITIEEFSFEIERRVWIDKNDTSYIHHTSKYLEELDLDAEEGKRFISPSLMDKIRHEAVQMKLLKERNTTSSVMQF